MRHPMKSFSVLITASALCFGPAIAQETPETGLPDTPEAATDLPDPEAWEDGPDRETLVRFARAWGQVTGVLEADEAYETDETDEADADPVDARLRDPDALPRDLRRQVRRHIRNNGLSRDEWSGLLARMEDDPDFRSRVEMLALPYRTQTN